jgi:cell division protein ZapA
LAQVSVVINGRKYPVACDDGQEERILGLAQYIDGKVTEFAKKLGQVGEARLLLLASLMIADELAEATDNLRRQRRPSSLVANGHAGQADTALASGIDSLAQRIEAIAERLEKTHL